MNPTNTTQRTSRKRRFAILGGIVAAIAAVAFGVVATVGASALLGSENTGSATVTYADHTQVVYTNGAANVLNLQFALVPGSNDSEDLGIANGAVASSFKLEVTPPTTGTVDASQVTGLSIAVTDADTGATVVPQTAITSLTNLNLGNLAAGQSRTFRVTVYEDASVTVGGGSLTTGIKLVGTQA